VGDVDVSVLSGGADHEVAQGGQDVGRLSGSGLAVVFVKGPIADVMLLVRLRCRTGYVGWGVRDAVGDLFAGALAVEILLFRSR
jgi:hypothetical protein